MTYISTRGEAASLSFEDVLLAGLARDGGLYVPETWPALSPDTIASFAGRPFAEVAAEVVRFADDAREVLGDDRACSYMRKFYPWYLAGQPVPTATLEQMLRAPTLEDALELLHDAAGAPVVA